VNKILIALIAAVTIASGCVDAQKIYEEKHVKVVDFLEDDEDHKAVIGVIAGETDTELHDIRAGQKRFRTEEPPSLQQKQELSL